MGLTLAFHNQTVITQEIVVNPSEKTPKRNQFLPKEKIQKIDISEKRRGETKREFYQKIHKRNITRRTGQIFISAFHW